MTMCTFLSAAESQVSALDGAHMAGA